MRRRINFYRALVALPADITFDAVKNGKDQKTALMMSANNLLDHLPPTNWTWYTPDGAEGAGNSNLVLGRYGPAAVDAYMVDPGANNHLVGHCRWLMYSRASVMGRAIPTGDSRSRINRPWGWRGPSAAIRGGGRR